MRDLRCSMWISSCSIRTSFYYGNFQNRENYIINNYHHFVILVLSNSFIFEYCAANSRFHIISLYSTSVCVSNTEHLKKKTEMSLSYLTKLIANTQFHLILSPCLIFCLQNVFFTVSLFDLESKVYILYLTYIYKIFKIRNI